MVPSWRTNYPSQYQYLPQFILLPCMVCLSTMGTLLIGDLLALCDSRPSVHVVVQLLVDMGYLLEARLFPNKVLLLVPCHGQAVFLFFLRKTLLTVCKQVGALVVLACVSKSEESSTLVFGCSNKNSDAVNPDIGELKNTLGNLVVWSLFSRRWYTPSARCQPTVAMTIAPLQGP